MADAPSEDEWTGLLYAVCLSGALKKERAGEPLNDSQRDLLAQHREWEAENQQKATPIIALTAHALKEHIQKSLDAGCNAHLTKPIKKANLLAAIEKYAL